MLGFTGAAVYRESWRSLQIFLVVCAIIVAVLYLKRDRIMTWVHERHREDLPDEEQSGDSTDKRVR
jgi:hypothetical protein